MALASPTEARGDPGAVATLTTRQQEVLYLMAMGCADREIAGRLGIGVSTVKNHTSAIYAELGVRGRVDATVVWYRHALALAGQGGD